jgi:hypothetical protein
MQKLLAMLLAALLSLGATACVVDGDDDEGDGTDVDIEQTFEPDVEEDGGLEESSE